MEVVGLLHVLASGLCDDWCQLSVLPVDMVCRADGSVQS